MRLCLGGELLPLALFLTFTEMYQPAAFRWLRLFPEGVCTGSGLFAGNRRSVASTRSPFGQNLGRGQRKPGQRPITPSVH